MLYNDFVFDGYFITRLHRTEHGRRRGDVEISHFERN